MFTDIIQNILTKQIMKNYYLALLLFGFICNAQIGVGTTSPNSKSVLDLTSTTKGFLPPRMTYAEKTAILSPPAGLQIWCTDCSATGELQVFNGTSWVTYSLIAGSLPQPSAPLNVTATAIYKQATVSFSAPASNGGSVITGYTVTSSPGSFIATGGSSPLIVTGLTNGTSYTFTVVATNSICNSPASSASVAVVPNCGAYIASGVYKVFACFNLGATDTTGDENTPVQGTNGDYYEWGRSTPAATTDAIIGTWNTTDASDGSWLDASKTANDPCPTGFRVPTNAQWIGVANTSLNTLSHMGSWVNDGNFTTAVSFETATVKTLTLPSAGRRFTDGYLLSRGQNGFYQCSTVNGIYSHYLYTTWTSCNTTWGLRRLGYSVRCISE